MNRRFYLPSIEGSSGFSQITMDGGIGVPVIMQLNATGFASGGWLTPPAGRIYATTAASSDQLTDENLIATVTVSGTTQTVTIINNGKALSNKSYIGLVRTDGKTSAALVLLDFDLASTVKVYDGTSWNESYVRVNNGTEFVPAQVFRYDGTQWVECTLYEPW